MLQYLPESLVYIVRKTPWTPLRIPLAAALLALLLSGCDIIQQEMGIEDPATKEAEGRAVGGACRQSGRAIEDCYAIYAWLSKASIYEGWRDMDAYMRENNLETVAPQLPPVPPPEPPTPRKKAPSTEKPATKGVTG
jgi:hypothetical protein